MKDKIKVENMACYEQVVNVIGHARAKIELFKVISNLGDSEECSYWGCFTEETLLDGSLFEAFYWDYTPQGYDFWKNVSDGFNPYDD